MTAGLVGVDGGAVASGDPTRGLCMGGSGPSVGVGDEGGEDGMGSGQGGVPGVEEAPCRCGWAAWVWE